MSAMHSAIDRMLKASSRLPNDLSIVFAGLFMQRKTPEEICAEHKLTMSEFMARRSRLLRTLRNAT